MHSIQRVRTNLYAALSGTALSQAIAGVAQVMIVRTLGVESYVATRCCMPGWRLWRR